jgi:hypothetical protein
MRRRRWGGGATHTYERVFRLGRHELYLTFDITPPDVGLYPSLTIDLDPTALTFFFCIHRFELQVMTDSEEGA